MRPTRTNPAYAALAYRKAILGELITRLTSEYTGAMGDNPSKVILSGDLVREDSEVPEEEIGMFVEQLQQEEESLRLQLLKFDFVRRDEQKAEEVRNEQPKDPAGKRSRATKSGPAQRKRKQ